MNGQGQFLRRAFLGLGAALVSAVRFRLSSLIEEIRFRRVRSKVVGAPLPMTVAIVGGTDRPMPPTGYGGVETTLYNLAIALRDQGWTVHLWGVFQRERLELYDGIVLHEGTDVSAREIIVLNPALVYLAWPSALQLRRLANDPRRVVIGEFNHPSCFPPHVARTYVRCMNSLFARDALAAGYPADRIIQLPHWQVGETQYRPDIAREEWLLWVGRPDRTKALEEAFRFAILTGEQLHVYAPWYPGDQEWAQVLERVRPPNVHYLGELSRVDKETVFSRCRALLYTANPGYKEAFGLVFLEALESGTPVVALDHHEGSTQSWLFPGPPIGLRAADTDALAAKWIMFKNDLNPEAVRRRCLEVDDAEVLKADANRIFRELVTRHAA